MSDAVNNSLSDTLSKEVLMASPCISICALDENDICVGCYRSAAEITRWAQAQNPERQQILVSAAERAKASNPF